VRSQNSGSRATFLSQNQSAKLYVPKYIFTNRQATLYFAANGGSENCLNTNSLSLWTADHVVTKRTRRVYEGDYYIYKKKWKSSVRSLRVSDTSIERYRKNLKDCIARLNRAEVLCKALFKVFTLSLESTQFPICERNRL